MDGDIPRGWLLAQMDTAGSISAAARARGRVAISEVEAMRFHEPVVVGDLVSCHARIVRETTRSIRVAIEVRARRRFSSREVKVTDGTFVYVAIDTMGRPRPLGTAKDVGMAKSLRSRSP